MSHNSDKYDGNNDDHYNDNDDNDTQRRIHMLW